MCSDDFGMLPDSYEDATSSPRSPRRRLFATPPRTPRTPSSSWRSSFRSPPPAPHEAERPPLMQALYAHSLERVRSALLADPDAASLPFFEHALDTPLGCAVRAGCSAEILRLLLECGACVDDVDLQGRTALASLCAAPRSRSAWTDYLRHLREEQHAAGYGLASNVVEAAQVLLEAGADPALRDLSGRCAIDFACDAGNEELLKLFRDSGFAEQVHTASKALGPGGAPTACPWCACRQSVAGRNNDLGPADSVPHWLRQTGVANTDGSPASPLAGMPFTLPVAPPVRTARWGGFPGCFQGCSLGR